jgi:hypothetical protein
MGKGEFAITTSGEGGYGELERAIQKLLKENGATDVDTSLVSVSGEGIEAAPSEDVQSPETYIGYLRAEHFASPERLAQDSIRTYSQPVKPT